MLKFENGNIVTGNYPVFCHQVNCKGVMGSGLAKQIRDTYPEVYGKYRQQSALGNNLGQVLAVRTNDNRLCINMYSQDDYGRTKCHTDYMAFKRCLQKIAALMKSAGMSRFKTIAFPYGIGCGLAGGDWRIVLKMLQSLADEIQQDVVIVRFKQ